LEDKAGQNTEHFRKRSTFFTGGSQTKHKALQKLTISTNHIAHIYRAIATSNGPCCMNLKLSEGRTHREHVRSGPDVLYT
jgi:hypothetical protein